MRVVTSQRHNAFFIFQEDDLGSIAPGTLADLAMIDRDYLTIPAEHLKDIKPVMTMVGGRVVHDAESAVQTARRNP
jgi:predicted amidohydrolase YtcJ